MSELAVGSLKGLAANSFVIDVAAGSTLNVPPPAILQVVSTTRTTVFTTAATTFQNVGLSVTITPSSASSKFLLLGQVTGDNSDTGFYRFNGGGAENYVGDTSGSRVSAVFGGFFGISSGNTYGNSMIFLASPATTSPVTFDIQLRVATGGTVFMNRSKNDDNNANRGRGSSSLTVLEVAG